MVFMSLTKAELIKLLQEDDSPMDTPIGLLLECTNDDAQMSATKIRTAGYNSWNKKFMIYGDYEWSDY